MPFCARKCPYCDFNTYAVSKVPEDEYVAALIKELNLYRHDPKFYKRQVRTVFFGGGTPSILSDASISRIIDSINQCFGIAPEAEITLEANPNDADKDKLEGFKRGGVNRLSFGAQSFDSKALAFLGRDHKPEDVIQAVESSISVGLDNISVDIIYGLPDQSISALEEDLRAALALPITHLSTYSLTIEPGTPFYQRQERGFLKMPPDSRVAKMLDFIPAFLESRGLFRYEISNFSKPGRESAHNLVYWSGGDYLGLGAGAHSYCGEYQADEGGDSVLISAKRWSNLALPASYVEKISLQGDVLAWREQLLQKDLHFEFFYLGMRKIAGVSEEQFLKRFGFAIPEGIVSALNELVNSGFVVREGDIIRLSAEGISLADSVFERLAGA